MVGKLKRVYFDAELRSTKWNCFHSFFFLSINCALWRTENWAESRLLQGALLFSLLIVGIVGTYAIIICTHFNEKDNHLSLYTYRSTPIWNSRFLKAKIFNAMRSAFPGGFDDHDASGRLLWYGSGHFRWVAEFFFSAFQSCRENKKFYYAHA